jgi:hypothetical protein
MKPIVLAAFAVAAVVASAEGQKAETWLTKLGNDTVAFERFTRSGDRLEGEFVLVSPRLRLNQYQVEFNANGTVRQYQLSSRAVVDGPGVTPPVEATAQFGDGAIVVVVTRGGKADTSKVAAGAAVPNSFMAWGLFGLATQAARRLPGDSAVVEQWGVGARQTTKTAVSRRGDSLVVDFFGSPMMVAADRQGRPSAVNGARTTVKVLAQRVDGLDIGALSEMFASRERAGQVAGTLSPRDTVVANVRGVSFWVDYGRPSKRGRQLVGGIVPFDQVWRTGANAATQIRFDKAITLNGVAVPAGTYTLWTLPTTRGVKLIVNQQTGQWGTSYDAAQDLVRVDADVEKLGDLVERFTISVVDAGDHGELRFDWDHTRWVVRFTGP